MDRAELSSAIRQEMQGVVGEALATVAPEVLTADLATREQRVQQVGCKRRLSRCCWRTKMLGNKLDKAEIIIWAKRWMGEGHDQAHCKIR